MKLFLLTRLAPKIGQTSGFLIASTDWETARAIADRNRNQHEHDGDWMDNTLTMCQEIASDTWLDEGLILQEIY